MIETSDTLNAPPADARARILRAAERLFAEKGYAATSVQEITEAASVNKALLYYYFEDKHSLYVGLIDEGIADFREMLDEALGQPGSYSDRLRAFVAGHVRLLWSRRDVVRVVRRCLLAGEEKDVGLVEKFGKMLNRLASFVAAGIEAGEFRAVDPVMTALSLVSATDKFSCAEASRAGEFTQEQVVDHVTDLLLYGLCNRR